MWVLVIVFLNGLGTMEIERYETREACQVERDRIGREMAEAYPYDHDFDIICRVDGRVI